MVKKFTTNCDFSGKKFPVTFYVGDSASDSHPLGFQSKWLGKERGGNVPQDIMDAFTKLKAIAEKSKVPFEDLCEHVIEELKSNDMEKDLKKATAFSGKKIEEKPKAKIQEQAPVKAVVKAATQPPAAVTEESDDEKPEDKK